jgi:hypothetical protein
LTADELAAVEKDFVQFLAGNSVTAPDWQALKSNAHERVAALIEEFSESFWERATAKITHLERRMEKDIWMFSFGEEGAELVRCQLDEAGTAHWSTGTKSYPQEARGREIFLLLEQGARPTDEAAFEAFKKGA